MLAFFLLAGFFIGRVHSLADAADEPVSSGPLHKAEAREVFRAGIIDLEFVADASEHVIAIGVMERRSCNNLHRNHPYALMVVFTM